VILIITVCWTWKSLKLYSMERCLRTPVRIVEILQSVNTETLVQKCTTTMVPFFVVVMGIG
jgi:hypothetical protein